MYVRTCEFLNNLLLYNKDIELFVKEINEKFC